jgi:hypothetical protein
MPQHAAAAIPRPSAVTVGPILRLPVLVQPQHYRFQLYLSEDEGKTWKWKIPIEHVEPGKGGFSYPSFIQTRDGMLRMTYSSHIGTDQKSIKYVVVDPSKIK